MEKKVTLPYEAGSLLKSKENEEDIIKVCSYTIDNNSNIMVGINNLKDQVYENVRLMPLEELKDKYEYTHIVMVGNKKYFDNGISLVNYEETKNKQL